MALLQPGMPRHLSYIDVQTGRPVVDHTFKVLRYPIRNPACQPPGTGRTGPTCTKDGTTGLAQGHGLAAWDVDCLAPLACVRPQQHRLLRCQ